MYIVKPYLTPKGSVIIKCSEELANCCEDHKIEIQRFAGFIKSIWVIFCGEVITF